MAGTTASYREARVQDGSGRIEVSGLTKRFGPVTAVEDLSFVVEPGSVTGFIGPNGAGKTTTMRMLLGLISPSAGSATINGVPYGELGQPARVVGAVLEAQSFHPKRTARNHLRVYAAAIGVPDEQAEQVLGLVGLAEAGNRKVGGFSMGMKQRLALATALLGDPRVLVLDEPSNGLDPEGIAWLRNFLKSFASTGRTVLVSSHLLAELQQTIDQVVIISRGRCVYYGQLDELRQSQQNRVLVQPGDPHKLVDALHEAGFSAIETLPDGRLAVVGAYPAQVADIALAAGVPVLGMAEETVDLERLFLRLTSGEFSSGGAGPAHAGGTGVSPGPGQPPPGYVPPGAAPSTPSPAPRPNPGPGPNPGPDSVWAPPAGPDADPRHRGLGGNS